MTSTSLVGDSFFGIDVRELTARLRGMRRHVSKRVLLLEFASEELRVAEARFSGAGLQYDHLTRFPLPQDALERCVPADPVKMGRLIQQICREKQISVHRAAVVLPSEVAFQHLIDLPIGLSAEELRAYVLDPSNGLQIPIALGQADFDVLQTQLPSVKNASASALQSHLITAIPGNLVDRVTETLQVADFELQALEVGSHSQLRLMISDLMLFSTQQLRLVLELQSECTHFSLVGVGGAFRFERLAAIRDFPDPDLTDEQSSSVLQEGGVAETICIRKESYLAISELDLRVLISEVRDALRRFSSDWSGFELVDIVLTGRNSAHLGLPALLSDEFGCPVQVLEPLLAHGVEGVQFESLVIQKSLNRLIGLGLGLLPNEHLLACPLSDVDRSLDLQRGIPLMDISPPLNSDLVASQLLTMQEVLDQDPDHSRRSQIALSNNSTDIAVEQSSGILELSNPIDVGDEVIDEIKSAALPNLHDVEHLKGSSTEGLQTNNEDALPPVVQDKSDDTHFECIVGEAEPIDRNAEQSASIDFPAKAIVEDVQMQASEQYDHHSDKWPSVINSDDMHPNPKQITDYDVPKSAYLEGQSNKDKRTDEASSSSSSLDLVDECAFTSSLDQVENQWPSIANSGNSLTGSSEARRVDVSVKTQPDQEGMKSEQGHPLAEQDEQSLIGELRFSDEE